MADTVTFRPTDDQGGFIEGLISSGDYSNKPKKKSQNPKNQCSTSSTDLPLNPEDSKQSPSKPLDYDGFQTVTKSPGKKKRNRK